MHGGARIIRWATAAALVVALILGAAAGPGGPGGPWGTVYAQGDLRWGGRWQVVGDAYLDRQDRLALDASVSLRLQAQTRTFPWRVFFDGRAGGRGPVVGQGDWRGEAELDRLYLRYYTSNGHLSLGKQFVNWGVGYAFAPTDVFNPPDPTDPDAMRPGLVSAVGQWSVGPLDYWSVAVAEGKYGVRRRGNVRGTDWAVLAVRDQSDTILGLDLQGDLGVGWYVAAAYRMPGEAGAANRLEGLVGADYSWLGGRLIWVGEYPFTLWFDGDPHRPRRQQLFQQLTYRMDDFTSFFGSVLFTDLAAGRALWNLGGTTALSSDSQLKVVLTLQGGTPDPALPPPPKAKLRVEFWKAF